MTDPNDPAFSDKVLQKGQTFEQYDQTPVGLTKREYFAAVAMQGLIPTLKSDEAVRLLPSASVRLADALIAELNKEPPK